MRDIPFKYNPVGLLEGDNHIGLSELIPERIGIEYWDVERNISVIISATVQYESGDIECFKQEVSIRQFESYTLDCDTIRIAFENHALYGKIKYMEVIIFPVGCHPLKWRLHLEETAV